jgi:hypothetical protein
MRSPTTTFLNAIPTTEPTILATSTCPSPTRTNQISTQVISDPFDEHDHVYWVWERVWRLLRPTHFPQITPGLCYWHPVYCRWTDTGSSRVFMAWTSFWM